MFCISCHLQTPKMVEFAKAENNVLIKEPKNPVTPMMKLFQKFVVGRC